MLLKQSVGVKVTLEFHFIAVGFWVFRIARVLRCFCMAGVPRLGVQILWNLRLDFNVFCVMVHKIIAFYAG